MNSSREKIAEFVTALKAACRKSHKGGPGGSRMCICGAGCGGSAACNTLYFLKDAIDVQDMETLNVIAEFL